PRCVVADPPRRADDRADADAAGGGRPRLPDRRHLAAVRGAARAGPRRRDGALPRRAPRDDGDGPTGPAHRPHGARDRVPCEALPPVSSRCQAPVIHRPPPTRGQTPPTSALRWSVGSDPNTAPSPP